MIMIMMVMESLNRNNDIMDSECATMMKWRGGLVRATITSKMIFIFMGSYSCMY